MRADYCSKIYRKVFKPSAAEIEAFSEDKVNTMASDALTPYINNPSATMVFNL